MLERWVRKVVIFLPRDSHSPYIHQAQDFDIDIASPVVFPCKGCTDPPSRQEPMIGGSLKHIE
jgi:hypothetical protein